MQTDFLSGLGMLFGILKAFIFEYVHFLVISWMVLT